VTRPQLLALITSLPIDDAHACWGNAAESLREACLDIASHAAVDRAADEWSAMVCGLPKRTRPTPDPQPSEGGLFDAHEEHADG
jgi:hypothetical protein